MKYIAHIVTVISSDERLKIIVKQIFFFKSVMQVIKTSRKDKLFKGSWTEVHSLPQLRKMAN